MKKKYIVPEMEIDLFEDRASLVMSGSGDDTRNSSVPSSFGEATMFTDIDMGPFGEAFSGGETVEELPVEDPQISFVPDLAEEAVADPTAAPEVAAPAIDPVIEVDVITELFE